MEKYKPDKKGLMLKYGSIAASGVIAGGGAFAIVSCSSDSEQWAETSGQAGQINLEAVEEAMKDSKDVTEFEKRVNEIYTGDEMVLVEVKNEGEEQLVSGYADLNDNLQIDYDQDEKLFTFRRWFENGENRYEMRGHGVNSYYYHPYPPGSGLLTTYLLWSALTRPMYSTVPIYYTPVPDRQNIRTYRTQYRQTPSYRNQVQANKSFQTRMSSQHGTTYRQASPGASRQRWAAQKGVNLNKATSISKGRSGGLKSSWGSRTSRGFGGFRGGSAGGGVGIQRWAITEKR